MAIDAEFSLPMKTFLYLAAFLAFGVGVIHSVLGEKYILTQLFRRDNLPKLFGSPDFTMQVDYRECSPLDPA